MDDQLSTYQGPATSTFVINMPQMAIEALSENWLFKELGNLHWEMICEGLQTKSFDLKNDTGNRLYATFVRIRIQCEESLKSFKENDTVEMSGKINRFGNSMYFSDISFQATTGKVKAELMTTFSIRDAVDNTRLAKSEPDGLVNNIEKAKLFPTFGNEYRLVKKQVLKELKCGDWVFEIKDEVLFETQYELNPYYDLNGVNLLYFAAYPIINDVCEARYFNQKNFEERYEQTYYTAYKDVLYYANCNLNDAIIYQLNDCRILDDNYHISSTLRRKSDNEIIARIFTVKHSLSKVQSA